MATAPSKQDIVVLKPPEARTAEQEMPVFFGVSEGSTDAQGISMNVTAFPPGGKSNAHMHRDFETAIYVQSGRIALFYGDSLQEMQIGSTGDFIYIPPFLPHKAYNLSSSEPAIAISARNDPREQENVVVTPDADDGTADKRAKEHTT